jgi:hypothetical protein
VAVWSTFLEAGDRLLLETRAPEGQSVYLDPYKVGENVTGLFGELMPVVSIARVRERSRSAPRYQGEAPRETMPVRPLWCDCSER